MKELEENGQDFVSLETLPTIWFVWDPNNDLYISCEIYFHLSMATSPSAIFAKDITLEFQFQFRSQSHLTF